MALADKALTSDPPDFTSGLFDGQNVGLLLNSTSTAEPLKVIYGQREVGDPRVFIESNGTDNEFLHLVIVCGEGECSSINAIKIDGVLSTDAHFNSLVDIHHHLETDDQAADPDLVSRVAGWTKNHKLSGAVYTYICLKWDEEAFNGFPTITADGNWKIVYDVRDLTWK